MRELIALLTVLFFFTLAACDKADYEKKAESDADARRIINTGSK